VVFILEVLEHLLEVVPIATRDILVEVVED
jgi:hypothetical protein